MKNRLQWDDALDVWGVHGGGGFLGVVMLGLFATTRINANGANGLLYGNPSFFVKQLVAGLVCSIYAFLFSYVALVVINRISPVRVGPEEEEMGLDFAEHGEEAYLAD